MGSGGAVGVGVLWRIVGSVGRRVKFGPSCGGWVIEWGFCGCVG